MHTTVRINTSFISDSLEVLRQPTSFISSPARFLNNATDATHLTTRRPGPDAGTMDADTTIPVAVGQPTNGNQFNTLQGKQHLIAWPSKNIHHPYKCMASWRGDYGLRLWTERSSARVSAAAMWRCVLGQDTSPACALSRPHE